MKRSTPNRLSREKSPYLLQHANNPVDWHAWNEESFSLARSRDVPIFLSIGYSTCHWCHVMERESFENDDIAKVLNENFVSIKVDREELPDVDHVYMTALTQVLRQSGGWPLSMWLTPDLRPFFGGTYFPPDSGFGRPGFRSLLLKIVEAWKGRRELIAQDAARIGEALKGIGELTGPGALDAALVDRGKEAFDRVWDPIHGGMGSAPKFPQSPSISYLIHHHARTGDADSLAKVERQLDGMRRGGIYDQLGGGFARYSTDEEWRVPHFEKMLYDNAQLLGCYSTAFKITGNPAYAAVARETADYLLRDMAHPEGGLFSAEDADSEGVEGKFYVWRLREIEELLGPEAPLFIQAYGVTETGNWEDPHHDTAGLTVLTRKGGPESVEIEARLARARRTLLDARAARVRPGLDDKILASWNGLAISGLVAAATALEEPRYLEAARRSARFVRDRLTRDGGLLRRWREGEAKGDGILEDYAFVAAGLLDLHAATFEEEWFHEARRLTDEAIGIFFDPVSGGFYSSPADRSDLIARDKGIEDGASPSAGAVMALNCLRLGHALDDKALWACGERTLQAYATFMERHPLGFPSLLVALDYWAGPRREIVIAGTPGKLTAAARRTFLPRTVLLPATLEASPACQGKTPLKGMETAYVCENFACRTPVTAEAELLEELKPSSGSKASHPTRGR